MSLDRLAAALQDRYTIERELGAGGMATVYLAQDLKHGRQVAIKVLKPELAAVLGAERFVVEIKTTAALQHPHILPLFDSGESDGFLWYAMPYIQGETLRDKLDRETQFGVEEAVRITTEVADALHYAHTQGVVHRDIKPENILLANGRPMVADFGIALALSAAAGGRMTETGMSLGTPHYMSPEQATADKEITGRSDVYSLASVLYEMLTGDPPHTGSSAQQIIMKIIAEEPAAVTKMRKSVPPNVAAAVARALEKVPADRFDTAAAFAAALRDPSFTTLGTASGAAMAGGASRARLPWLAGAAVLGIVAGAAGFALLRGGPEAPPVVRFDLTVPAGQRLRVTPVDGAPFAISPDGQRIVYVATDSASRRLQLFVRTVDQLDGVPLQGTDNGVTPFFSPDGLWVGFVNRVDNTLMKVPVNGGPATTLASDILDDFGSASWGEDGSIVYVSDSLRLSRVSGAGGRPEVVATRDSLEAAGGGIALWPDILPGGKGVLFTNCGVQCETADLSVLDLSTGSVRTVVPNASRGWYLSPGILLFATDVGTIYAVDFDVKRMEVTGTPIPVLDDVLAGLANGSKLAISQAGAMVYLGGGLAETRWQLVEVDRSGRETLISLPNGNYGQPRWSPTRDRIAISRPDAEGIRQIWIHDLESETLSQLTFTGQNLRPSWSPDGRRVAYSSARDSTGSLYWIPADASGPPEQVVTEGDVLGATSTFWSRDGAWIIIDGYRIRDDPDEDIYAVGTGADRSLVPVVSTPNDEEAGAVSPDGKWIAYTAVEAGDGPQVFVRPFMAPGGKFLISQGLAVAPLWSGNDELIYHDLVNREMVAAKLALGASVRVVQRSPLFSTGTYRSATSAPEYDVSSDGQHFLMLRRPPVTEDINAPTVVLNWVAEVRRLMAAQGAN